MHCKVLNAALIMFTVAISACDSSGQVRDPRPLNCINGEQLVCTGTSAWRLEQSQDQKCSCQRMDSIDKIH